MLQQKTTQNLDFSQILQRIGVVKGHLRDKELAQMLGITAANFSDKKYRDAVPLKEIIFFCRKEYIDPMWLLFGDVKIDETKEVIQEIERNLLISNRQLEAVKEKLNRRTNVRPVNNTPVKTLKWKPFVRS